MEHCQHQSFEKYYQNFTIEETRLYMRQALEILAEIHERGIMHRDIKPQNLLYNRDTKVLKLIDFGRAEEYTSQAKSVNVGSKFFKAPELLVGYTFYDFGVDIWNLGLILGCFIFRKYPLLYFRDPQDLLDVIVEVFGFQRLFKFLNKYSISIPDSKKKKYFGISGAGFQFFVSNNNSDNLDEEALDLLDKMLVIDPQDRISAREALKHPFFKS